MIADLKSCLAMKDSGVEWLGRCQRIGRCVGSGLARRCQLRYSRDETQLTLEIGLSGRWRTYYSLFPSRNERRDVVFRPNLSISSK